MATSRITRDLMAVTADRAREQGRDSGTSGEEGVGAAGGRTCLVQGYLLKRSETLHLWNQRWFVLDPTTARMEYRMQRSDVYPRGHIVFDSHSTITVSPLNFHGAKQYEGCCFYVGTAGKKEYFLCAETPEAARAWVSTIRAAAQVLKAHRAAVSLLGSSNEPALSGAVAAATAAAVEAAGQAQRGVAEANVRAVQHGAATATTFFSLTGAFPAPAAAALTPHSIAAAAAATSAAATGGRGAAAGGPSSGGVGSAEANAAAAARLGAGHVHGSGAESGDSVHLLKETLRVKDEEIHALSLALRERDAALASLAARLEEAAAAADAAAAAAAQAAGERDAAVRAREEVRVAAGKLCEDLEARFAQAEAQQAGSKAGRADAEQQAERARAELALLQAALTEARERGAREEAGRRAAEREMLRWKAEAERFMTAGLASFTPSCLPSTTTISTTTTNPSSLPPPATATSTPLPPDIPPTSPLHPSLSPSPLLPPPSPVPSLLEPPSTVPVALEPHGLLAPSAPASAAPAQGSCAAPCAPHHAPLPAMNPPATLPPDAPPAAAAAVEQASLSASTGTTGQPAPPPPLAHLPAADAVAAVGAAGNADAACGGALRCVTADAKPHALAAHSTPAPAAADESCAAATEPGALTQPDGAASGHH
ncbi:hypothetical protein CLOM_g16986 [Closterium sp. NIES-68]|nr:hypothetical protein CLOM_g16986 [Closterium sp. NIES-68]GJP62763.1 hypothetical protein CLOP_g19790 [Closterium sp. NIES-67]